MKTFATLAAIIAGISISPAAEVVESLKTRTGKEYFKVEILEKDAIGLKIRHDAGTARVPFDNLPDELQSKYRFNHREAKQQKAKEAQEMGVLEPRTPEEGKSAANTRPQVKRPAAPVPVPVRAAVLEVPPAENPNVLEAEISALRLRIKMVESEITFLEKQSSEEKQKHRWVQKPGNPHGVSVPDKGAAARARKYDKEVSQHQANIIKAEFMIREKKTRYLKLTGSEVQELYIPEE